LVKENKEAGQTREEILKELKDITEANGLAESLSGNKLVMVFQCNGTGLYFPSDYIEEWGRKYGHGLGKTVVSECLETAWGQDLAVPKNLRRPEQIMYPLKQGNHGITAVMVTPEEAKGLDYAILMIDDPFGDDRTKIIRDKQMKNKNGLLKAMTAVLK